MKLEREVWVDNVKVFACILVVLGHLFQSLSTEIIQENNLLKWFDQTIYYFHVPLFFFCSGYLYQKREEVNSIQTWTRNIKKKAIALGIPYVVFTILTWLLKIVFADEVNGSVDGLAYVLFISPLSPYWYLYALFFVFVVTPTLRTKQTGVVLFVICSIVQVLGERYENGLPQILKYLMFYEVWFVFGMTQCMCVSRETKEKENVNGLLISVIFIVLSIISYKNKWNFIGLKYIMGVAGCIATISVIEQNVGARGCKFAAYTMQVYLLHTICAAPVRILLMKLQITSSTVHVVTGVIASFLFPVLIAKIAAKVKWLEFWFYPGKYLKV